VWVNLAILFPTTADPDLLPAGVDVSEIAPGWLWEWARTSSGEWLGVVTFHLRYRDGRTDRYIANRQLVPAHVLRPPPPTPPCR